MSTFSKEVEELTCCIETTLLFILAQIPHLSLLLVQSFSSSGACVSNLQSEKSI